MTPKLGQKIKDNPKDIQYRIRMNEEESKMLEDCAKELGTSKARIILDGIKLMYERIFGNEQRD